MKKNPELKVFIDNVDVWIKQIRREFSAFKGLPLLVEENSETIQHNYELISELKDQIADLKLDIQALRMIQIISLKKTKQEPKI